MLTHLMAARGLRFMVSSQTVYHFTETAYRPELRPVKDRDCLKMLAELRAGRGMHLENFYLSAWVKNAGRRSTQIDADKI